MTAGSARAQSNVIEADVPFNFIVNNTLLPAGTYSLGLDSMHPDMLVIRDWTKSVKATDLGHCGSNGPGSVTC